MDNKSESKIEITDIEPLERKASDRRSSQPVGSSYKFKILDAGKSEVMKERPYLKFCYQIFYLFPIKYFCKGYGKSRRLYRTKAILFWLILALSVLYGYVQVLKVNKWKSNNISIQDDIYLWIARASGKLISVSVFIGLLLTNRTITSSIDELPYYRRGWLNWRKVHVVTMQLSLIMGIIHGVMHFLRINHFDLWIQSHEYYFIVTGGALFALLIYSLLPYFIFGVLEFLSVYECCPIPNTQGKEPSTIIGKVMKRIRCIPGLVISKRFFGAENNMKELFRKFHNNRLLILFCFIYTIHGYDIWVLLIGISWLWTNQLHKFNILKSYYRFNNNGVTSEIFEPGSVLEIFVIVRDRIPNEFGLYCQLSINGTSYSYTMIPKDHDDRGYCMMFRIAESTFTNQFNNIVQYVQKKEVIEIQEVSNNDRQYWTIPDETMSFNVYGPYHSLDQSIKDSSSKGIIVLSSGIGVTVAQSVLSFHVSKPGYWESVKILRLCGRKIKEIDPILRSIGVDDINEVDLYKLLNENRNTLDVQMFGEINIELVYNILSKANKTDHFIICSRIWSRCINKFRDTNVRRTLDGNVWERIHVEEFEI